MPPARVQVVNEPICSVSPVVYTLGFPRFQTALYAVGVERAEVGSRYLVFRGGFGDGDGVGVGAKRGEPRRGRGSWRWRGRVQGGERTGQGVTQGVGGGGEAEQGQEGLDEAVGQSRGVDLEGGEGGGEKAGGHIEVVEAEIGCDERREERG